MIVYDGVALESVLPVKIEDIRISPVQATVTARPRPISAGADFVRITDGTRQVAIVFAMLEDNRFQRAQQLMQLSAWAHRETEGRLELAHYPGMYLQCICTALPEPSTRQWWESKLRIVFTCYDNPYFTDKREKSAAMGDEFTVYGSAPPLMQIRGNNASAVSDPGFTNWHESMHFTSIPAGSMVINLNRQTASVNGQSIMQNYTFNSSFLLPRVGKQSMAGVGTVYWRERWE